MTEHAEQVALFEWAEWMINTGKYPELKWMFAVPNGGHRYWTVAKKLKAEGVKAGVPDVLLPAPSLWGEIGLAIEMKFDKNKTTESQSRWLAGLKELGWRIAVCHSFEEAKEQIEHYLTEPKSWADIEDELHRLLLSQREKRAKREKDAL